MSTASSPQTLDLDLPGGRVHAERSGPGAGVPVLCLHGLSGNLRSYDAIAPALAGQGRAVVAVDLRGRGASDVTPSGTYGLNRHVRDVLDLADALEAPEFDLVGWSLGALIGIRVAAAAPDRLRRLVLLDHAGDMDPSAVELVRSGLARLDAVVPSPEPYLDALRDAGVATPWGPFWEAVYRYELQRRPDGQWEPRTDRAACTEDFEDTIGDDYEARWGALSMPTLLVRATEPMGGGFIVPEAVRDALAAAVPRLEVVEVDRNHFGIMDAPGTVEAVARFLAGA